MFGKKYSLIYSCLFIFIFLTSNLFPQDFLEVSKGSDEFKWGVKSFYSGYYNKAVFSFEKSISYNPSDLLAREWLGRAYYMSGLDDTAVKIWKSVLDDGGGSVNLRNKLEIIESRRKLSLNEEYDKQWVLETEISGRTDEGYYLFKRPASLISSNSGEIIVSSFATNELAVFNSNGRMLKKIKGGFSVLNHPFDVIELSDGSFIVSEYEGNQLSKIKANGSIEKQFASRGTGDGQLLGPQYLADDKSGYIYVTDWGNRRVSKYDYDGNYILSFGKKTGIYPGFSSPTGIAASGEKIYVADSERNCLDIFDRSGNYLKSIAKDVFHKPEGISVIDEKNLMIADTDRIIRLNIEYEYVDEIYRAREGERLTSAVFDVNNDIIASDFNNSRIIFLTDMASVYGGLFVRIDRVVETDFPAVKVLVSVEDRFGNPVAGLEKGNFRISEIKDDVFYPDDINLLFQGDRSEKADTALVFENSVYMNSMKDSLRKAAEDFYSSLNSSDKVRLIESGEDASIVAGTDASEETVIKGIINSSSYSKECSPGAGIRLGGSELLNSVDKRAVVYIYSGSHVKFNFDRYRLVDIKQFLKNNKIGFYYIYLDPDGKNEELEFLCRETGGKSYYLYRPAGIAGIAEDIKKRRNGYYMLDYVSKHFSEYGRKYISLRVEAVYHKRSGRDELEYFAASE